MQPYSIDLRKKIIEVRQQENISIRKLAERFKVAKSFVQKLLKDLKRQEISVLLLKEEVHPQN